MAVRLFEDYDIDSNGSLSRAEVKELVETVLNEVGKIKPIDEKQRNKLFTMCDLDSDNKLTKKEFVKLIGIFLDTDY